ncbi:MAG: hypothetical protein Ct9H300mP23_11770 [Nitrospinota bacterium]|nr:MAG: hypothetical protein Ct9H300mP23_11770 [Nitrospinota bacterium]
MTPNGSSKKRNFEVKFQLEASPVLILDKKALQMVFNNLIGNAFRYSPGVLHLKSIYIGKGKGFLGYRFYG